MPARSGAHFAARLTPVLASLPHVGASLEIMDRDARKMRGERPFVFANIRAGTGVAEIASFIERQGGLARAA